jgi:tetratricopeptide (TPR) repeat protein
MRRIILLALVLVAGLAAAVDVRAGPHEDAQGAVAAMRNENWETAVALWTRAIDSGQFGTDQLVAAHGNRAASYYKLGKNLDALADYSRSLELAPNSGYPRQYVAYNYSNRAGLYVDLARYDLAVADANEALRLNPEDHLGYFYRALAEENLGQRDAAVADYRSALRIKPDHRSSLDALARLGVE